MSTTTKPRTSPPQINHTDMVHIECIACNRALCGAKLKGEDRDDSELDCIICAELDNGPCPKCDDW